MSAAEVDAYIEAQDEPAASTLRAVRAILLDAVPDGEEGMSYGAPVVRLGGQAVAGFSAAKHHVSYLPHSGTVLGSLTEEQLGGLTATKGALKIPLGSPPPDDLIRTLVGLRRAEAGV